MDGLFLFALQLPWHRLTFKLLPAVGLAAVAPSWRNQVLVAGPLCIYVTRRDW